MSLKTRCPACDTVFKIVPDQLKVSKGWVRCGRCAEVFDAAAHAAAPDEANPWPKTSPPENVTKSTATASSVTSTTNAASPTAAINFAKDIAFAPKNIATKSINTPDKIIFNASTAIALHPALGQNRALCMTPVGDAVPVGEALSAELWHWGEVHAGIATITAPIVEAFVPQMLNYESVGGVNFKKGCYPGQEVVARSQFRGTLKRRAYIAQIDATDTQPLVGQEVFHDSDAEQPCGMVVQVAKNPATDPSGGYSAIVSMQVSASTGGKLTLGSVSGANITLLPLPYPLLEDI